MKTINITAAGALVAVAAGLVSCGQRGESVTPAIPADAALEKRVKEIVSSMSLDDKVGQMCEVTIDVVTGPRAEGEPVHADAAKLAEAIGRYRVGSVLNTPYGEAQDTATWRRVIGEIQHVSMETIGIPDVYGVDQNHGTTYTLGGTMFPQEINMAASWNRELVEEGARICAYGSRACAIPWVYNPVMDLGRNPVWSRMWESFGEDPYLNGAMAVAMVKGYQGDDPNHLGQYNVGACLKHFMAYGVPSSGKDRTPSHVDMVEMREKFFHPYKEAIRAGALSVMVNSGINNGIPFHANRELLTGWLKEELDWDGMIVTDWADIHNLHERDRIASDYKEAIMLAVNAGIDMSMTPYDVEFCTLLKELVEEKKVPMERIDDAVSRIIRFKLRLGLFEHPMPDAGAYPLFGSSQHAAKATQLAAESEVLLKNDGLLPLAPGTRILVTGPNANSMRCLNGGWSYTWQGSDNPKFHARYNTIYEALCSEFGERNVMLETGMDYDQGGSKNWEKENDVRIERAVAAARGADVIVACVGESSYCETPGNINDLHLSANQTALVKAVAATGKPVVLVLNEGRPRIVRDLVPLCGAVVDVMLPGNYGGDALAGLLSGRYNFSGKLPFTYPMWINSLHTYDHKPSEAVKTMEGAYNYDARVDTQWSFGYGLSYTTFGYSDLTVSHEEFDAADELTVHVTVCNTGGRPGKEAVILYSADCVASLTPDIRRVRGFDKVELAPGESKTVEFKLPAGDLAFVGADGKWRLEEGDFVIMCGGIEVPLRCTATKVWESPNL